MANQVRPVEKCPECGGIAQVKRNGDWKCFASDIIGDIRVLVCEARGVTLAGELIPTRGSTNLWRTL